MVLNLKKAFFVCFVFYSDIHKLQCDYPISALGISPIQQPYSFGSPMSQSSFGGGFGMTSPQMGSWFGGGLGGGFNQSTLCGFGFSPIQQPYSFGSPMQQQGFGGSSFSGMPYSPMQPGFGGIQPMNQFGGGFNSSTLGSFGLQPQGFGVGMQYSPMQAWFGGGSFGGMSSSPQMGYGFPQIAQGFQGGAGGYNSSFSQLGSFQQQSQIQPQGQMQQFPFQQQGNFNVGVGGQGSVAVMVGNKRVANELEVDLQIRNEDKRKIKLEIEFGDMTSVPEKEFIIIETAPTSSLKTFLINITSFNERLNKQSFSDIFKNEPIEVLKGLASELMWLRHNYFNFDRLKSESVQVWLKDPSNSVTKDIMAIIENILDKLETVGETLSSGEGIGKVSSISKDREFKSAMLGIITGIILDITPVFLQTESSSLVWKSREMSDLEESIKDKQISGRCQLLSLLAEFPNFNIFAENNSPTGNKNFVFQNKKTEDFLNKLKLVRQILIGNVNEKYPQLGSLFSDLITSYKEIISSVGGPMTSALNQAIEQNLSVKSGIIQVVKDESVFIKTEVFTILTWGLAKYLAMFSELSKYERKYSLTEFTIEEINLLSSLVNFCSSEEIFMPLIYNKSAAANFNLQPNKILEELLINIIVKTCETLGDAVKKETTKGATVGFAQLKKLIIRLRDKFWFWPKNVTNDAAVAFKKLIMNDLLGSVKFNAGGIGSVSDSFKEVSLINNDAKEDKASLEAFVAILNELLDKTWKDVVFLPEDIAELTSAKSEAQTKASNPAR